MSSPNDGEAAGPGPNSSRRASAGYENREDELSIIVSRWSRHFVADGYANDGALETSIRNTIRLLRDGGEVPFLCRYRPDEVGVLIPAQVHALRYLVERHAALAPMRAKILRALDDDLRTGSRKRGGGARPAGSNLGGGDDYGETRRRVISSTSRTELDEFHAPFKKPAKGTISERIVSSHPDLAELVETFWAGGEAVKSEVFDRILAARRNLPGRKNVGGKKNPARASSSELSPRDCIVHLLGSKIAANPTVFDVVMELMRRCCQTAVKRATPSPSTAKARCKPKLTSTKSKYANFFDFSCRTSSLKVCPCIYAMSIVVKLEWFYPHIFSLIAAVYGSVLSHPLSTLNKDHSVLAIRRGVDAKELKMTNSIHDPDYVKRQICKTLLDRVLPQTVVSRHRTSYHTRSALTDAVSDAWSRLLQRRSCLTVWREKVADAERRAVQVFAQNLQSALMAPPQRIPSHVMAVDPGYQAGTKVALLDPTGRLVKHKRALSTVLFVGKNRDGAVRELASLLDIISGEMGKTQRASTSQYSLIEPVAVALGNGHGSDESRSLIAEASSLGNVPVDVRLVNEAGVSVWSVMSAASEEFPDMSPTLIGAVSIGRRLQDPMSELVKVPPRSLGLGMYQHDLPEKDMDSTLRHAAIDAVAAVGVDGNAASLELLKNIPGLSQGKLAEKVVAIRPLTCREDLKKVKGLGPKCFENCAAFVRINGSNEVLDSTRYVNVNLFNFCCHVLTMIYHKFYYRNFSSLFNLRDPPLIS